MIFLLVGWHSSGYSRRYDEFKFCLKRNVELKEIDQVFVFSENGTIPKIYHPKITLIKHNRRMTYQDYFSFINNNDAMKDSYNIIANSDIMLHKSISLCKEIPMDMRCIALSRHTLDLINLKEVDGYKHSGQDVWIFKGPVVGGMDADFFMGRGGCDLRMNYELQKAGYTVINISWDIKVFHVHMVKGENTYRELDCVPEPWSRVKYTSIEKWR